MTNNKDISLVLNKLNLDKDAQKKLEQIVSICNNIPALNILEVVAKNIEKDDFNEQNVHGKYESAYIKYTIKKDKAEKGNSTDKINVKTVNNQMSALVGAGQTQIEEFDLSNISDSNIYLTYKNLNKYFNGRTDGDKYETRFSFDKNNKLVAIKSKKTEQMNLESVSETKEYSEYEINKALENKNKNKDIELSL